MMRSGSGRSGIQRAPKRASICYEASSTSANREERTRDAGLVCAGEAAANTAKTRHNAIARECWDTGAKDDR